MDPTNNKAPQTTPKTTGGYGKRPMWQWVAIYVVVGIVVYGLIYYFFMRGSSPGY